MGTSSNKRGLRKPAAPTQTKLERYGHTGAGLWLKVASLAVAVLSCCAWLLLGRLTFTSAPSAPPPVQPADADGFCCFGVDDIRLERVGHAPGQLVLTVQNFLCEDALEAFYGEAVKAAPLFRDSLTSFPGHALRVDNWVTNGSLPLTNPVAREQAGHHILCLRSALEQLRAA